MNRFRSLAILVAIWCWLAPVFAFAQTTYYSKSSGDVSLAGNWNTQRDGSGTDATTFDAGNTWVIQGGHSMTLSAATDWNVDATGTVRIENAATWTNSSTGAVTIGTFQIYGGGTYIHNTGSTTVPGSTRQFSNATNGGNGHGTYEIQNYGTGAITSGITWGHVRINRATTTAGSYIQAGAFADVDGNFTMDAHGSHPFLFSGTAITHNIDGDVTVNAGIIRVTTGSPGAMQINIGGDLNLNSGTFTHLATTPLTIEFTGAGKTFKRVSATVGSFYWSVRNGASLSIDGDIFVSSSRTLTLNATSSLTIKPNSSLTIQGTADFGGQEVVMQSGATGSARLVVTGSISNASNTTVERYIGVPAARRAWRLLTAPLTGGAGNTVSANWQSNFGAASLVGTNITGPAGTGLDFTSAGYSMKRFNLATQTWDAVDNTTTEFQFNNSGSADNIPFFIFVRGDKTVTGSGSATVTTLKSKGTLQVGTQAFSATPGSGGYFAVGNPYAAPVNLDIVTRSSNIPKKFWFWDPNLNTIGGYVLADDTDNGDGTFSFTPTTNGSRSYNQDDKILQSGEAILVQASDAAAATITFEESHKSSTSNSNHFRTGGTSEERLHLGLYKGAGFADGATVAYDAGYSSAIDIMDGTKPLNTSENLAILRNGTRLMLERRASITTRDTIFLHLSQLATASYQFQVQLQNFSAGISAFMQDLYLNINTTLSLSSPTTYSFSTTADPASKNPERFRIVLQYSGPLPVIFTGLRAYQHPVNQVQLEWTVTNQAGMAFYDIERSTNGSNFSKAGTVPADNSSANYRWLDIAPSTGTNYYRVKGRDLNGKTITTTIVAIRLDGAGGGISVYPNPVTGNEIHISFSGMPAGRYSATLYNSAGQAVSAGYIQHGGGSAARQLYVPALPKGQYQMEIVAKSFRSIQSVSIR